MLNSDDSTASSSTAHSVHAEFRMQGWCPSGIKIDSLQILNEGGYKPYKVKELDRFPVFDMADLVLPSR